MTRSARSSLAASLRSASAASGMLHGSTGACLALGAMTRRRKGSTVTQPSSKARRMTARRVVLVFAGAPERSIQLRIMSWVISEMSMLPRTGEM